MRIQKGQIYGYLTVIKRSNDVYLSGYHPRWICRCKCGRKTLVFPTSLIRGRSTSCGCRRKEVSSIFRLKHGEARKGKNTREYRCWAHIKGRCENSNDGAYKNYGGRGITICEQWQSFEQFLQDMGRCPKGFSIERVNNNGNYEPSNCKWIPLSEQAKNKRNVRVKC